MLMKLFGLMRKLVTGDWKKLYNEELYYYTTYKCDSDDQIKEDELSVSMWHVWGKEMRKRF
jgi:hypothetical protein